MTGLRIDHYDHPGGRDAMLRFEPEHGPVVIAALPLFEEANRTRAFAVAVLRALATRGIGGVLPDLPGTGESEVATADASLSVMREAHAALADRLGGTRPVFGLGIRSGVLLDGFSRLRGRWQLSPLAGDEVLRELWRVREAAHGARPRPFDLFALTAGSDETVEIAGNLVSRRHLLAPLVGALPCPASDTAPPRVARLESDPREADVHLPGPPLWRRSEPGSDSGLVEAVAADVAGWIGRCGG